MHSVQTDVDVIGTRQKLFECGKVEDAPEHLGVVRHRVHDLHC